MKSIIITGKQGLGKTELANLIASGKNIVININSEEDCKCILPETEVVIFDAISSEKDWSLFKELSSKEILRHRPPYYDKQIEIDCSKMLLIGITNSPIDNQDARHSFIYNLY